MKTQLKQTELHVHAGGCLTAQDMMELGQNIDHAKVDWQPTIDQYQAVLGQTIDPISLFKEQNLQGLQDAIIVSEADGGDFEKFQTRFDFLIFLLRAVRQQTGSQQAMLEKMVRHHQSQNIGYVEYRCLYNPHADREAFCDFHREIAEFCHQASEKSKGYFVAGYIVSLPRDRALTCYRWVHEMLETHPHLRETVVGLDFCGHEQGHPPRNLAPFFSVLRKDNQKTLGQSLRVVCHVGESFFHQSLESAVRWCHEAAILGSQRLGHAIALGLDPAVAVDRRNHAHERETVAERLDQIAYDLQHAKALYEYDVRVDESALLGERAERIGQPMNDPVVRLYDPTRLAQIKRRQDYVLDDLASRGVVIEICPTSNFRMSEVRSTADHPIHRLLQSKVNLVVCADDPGLFDTTLADEVDWVYRHSGIDAEDLSQRLGDPRRFRLMSQLPPVE